MVGYQIFEMIEREVEVDFDRVEQKPFSLEQAISFNGVHFRYPATRPNSPDALQGVSFKIKANTSTAIVGPSGTGKSTLM